LILSQGWRSTNQNCSGKKPGEGHGEPPTANYTSAFREEHNNN
jgi:hypothetical protein